MSPDDTYALRRSAYVAATDAAVVGTVLVTAATDGAIPAGEFLNISLNIIYNDVVMYQCFVVCISRHRATYCIYIVMLVSAVVYHEFSQIASTSIAT